MRINMTMQVLKRLEPRRIEIGTGLLTILLCHLDDVGQAFSHKIAHSLILITRQYLLQLCDAKISVAADLALVGLLRSRDQAQYGGLAGTVSAHEANSFCRLNGKLCATQKLAWAKSEADIVKTDGQYLYTLTPSARWSQQATLNIVRTWPVAAAALVASAPGRYGAGGYAAAHYVKADPGAREPCFELEVGGARLGFVSIGFSEFGAAAAPGAAWPFRDVTRPYNVATVSRLVVLDGARGRGAATALLSACAAFHDLGVPCRVTTRKRAVAEKVLARLGVLAADDAKAAAAHRATRADDAARAVVLFDPALARVARRDTTPLAPKERGKNLTWNFWYTGAPLLHPTTRAPYAFVGGRARFAPADGPPEPP